MDYCRFSAAPVGRFVLDAHEEDKRLWPASDMLCSALQVINHLQDCAKDYAQLDRVYLPDDILRRHGASAMMLSAPSAPPELRAALAEIARRTSELVKRSAPADFRDQGCQTRRGDRRHPCAREPPRP